MKHLLILASISLVGCSSSLTVNDKYQPSNSLVGVAANLTRDWYYTVPDYALQAQQSCVDFALREMSAGEECKWHKGEAIGIVKLAKIDSTGCHTLLNTVYYKNKPKYFQENYCYNTSTNRWFRVK